MSESCCSVSNVEENKALKTVFWIVLAVNLVMFVVEFSAGYLARSNALIADSLDMLGDTFVYSISLFVVSKGPRALANASLAKGAIMLLLGAYVLVQTMYKIIEPTIPDAKTISLIGFIALVANLICFALLSRHKSTDINTKSAWICSRNDVVGNVSVILAGFLVAYFNSMWPDIVVGLAIAFLIIYSSYDVIHSALRQRKMAAS